MSPSNTTQQDKCGINRKNKTQIYMHYLYLEVWKCLQCKFSYCGERHRVDTADQNSMFSTVCPQSCNSLQNLSVGKG